MGYEPNIQERQVLQGKLSALRSVDKTLTKEWYPADAKATGEAINAIKKDLAGIDPSDAMNVSYSNANSGLGATKVQGAIDELAQNAKTGSVVTGPIGTKNYENGYSLFNKNHSDSVDYGTQVVDYAADGRNAHLDISALYNTLNFVTSDGDRNKVFHEGVKPFGNYTGNGDASARTIETGGIGRLILVYNIYYFSFVTPDGALVITLADGSIKWIESTKALFLNGNLTYATDNAAFNETDTTYYYQVV